VEAIVCYLVVHSYHPGGHAGHIADRIPDPTEQEGQERADHTG